jgi:hypothetical protein
VPACRRVYCIAVAIDVCPIAALTSTGHCWRSSTSSLDSTLRFAGVSPRAYRDGRRVRKPPATSAGGSCALHDDGHHVRAMARRPDRVRAQARSDGVLYLDLLREFAAQLGAPGCGPGVTGKAALLLRTVSRVHWLSFGEMLRGIVRAVGRARGKARKPRPTPLHRQLPHLTAMAIRTHADRHRHRPCSTSTRPA